MMGREPEHCPQCDSLVWPAAPEFKVSTYGSSIKVDVRFPYFCDCGRESYWEQMMLFDRKCSHKHAQLVRAARFSNDMQLEDLRCDNCDAEFTVLKVPGESEPRRGT